MMPERLLTGPGRLKKRSKFKGQKNASCAVCTRTCSYQLRSKERAKLVPRLPLPAPGSGLAATRLAEHPPAVFPFAMGSGGEKGAAKGSSGRHTDNPCKHRMAAPDKFQEYLNRPSNRERQKTRQPGFDNARRLIFSRLIVLFKAWLIAPWNRGMNQKVRNRMTMCLNAIRYSERLFIIRAGNSIRLVLKQRGCGHWRVGRAFSRPTARACSP